MWHLLCVKTLSPYQEVSTQTIIGNFLEELTINMLQNRNKEYYKPKEFTYEAYISL